MSSTPKGPNPEGAAGQQASTAPGPALDQTFLGVAPAKPAPPVAAPPVAAPLAIVAPAQTAPPPAALGSGARAPAPGSAIIAAPMISVQGSRVAVPTSPRPSRTGESAIPPGVPEPAPLAPVQLDTGWQSASRAPRATSPEETPAHGTPRELVSPASPGALQPQRTLAPSPPASPAGFSPEARAPLAPQVPPRMELGQQRTALASEYLRAARETALAGQVVAPQQEGAAAGRGWQETRAPDPSRDDFGTQASVAPPFPDRDREVSVPTVQPSFALAPPAPLPVPPPIGSMAASLPMPPGQHRAGQPVFGRTMLDSAGGPAAHDDRPSSAPFGRPSSLPGLPGPFEHVPMPRGSLSDQSALQIPIDQSSAAWDQLGLGHDSTEKLSGHVKSSARARWLLLSALATLAVAAIGFVTFGDRLTGSAQRQQALLPRPAAPLAPASLPLEAPPSADTRALRPSGLPAAPEALPPARGTPAGRELAATASARHSARSEPDSAEDEAAAASAARAAEALASPEEKLAAEAARQVIASRYPEALPMYRELARKFPQNTAYGAMARILEQKVAAAAAPNAANGANGSLPGGTP